MVARWSCGSKVHIRALIERTRLQGGRNYSGIRNRIVLGWLGQREDDVGHLSAVNRLEYEEATELKHTPCLQLAEELIRQRAQWDALFASAKAKAMVCPHL